jgi:ABC-2 type transport system permease protein
MNIKISYWRVFKNLIFADLVIVQQTLVDKCIDLMIWVGLTLFVTSYIMPYFGIGNDFGMFQFGGVLAAISLFEAYSSVVDFVADLQSDRIIDYQVTLPIPSWLAITAKAAYYFILYFILTLAMLPIGLLLLWNKLDITMIHYVYLFIALVAQALFGACFVIFAASLIDNMSQLGMIWSRFIFPMWYMGGFQFSWKALYHITPGVALFNLINPMMYVTEAIRVALLGQDGYIPFWISIFVICIFSLMFLSLGIWNLKRRLDYI